MRIGIVGAGAIGCYVGGKLAAHADVAFVGRESQRAALAAGLATQELDGATTRIERVTFVEIDALRECDAVLCCVKSAQTDEVGRELATVLREDAVIASLQNGVRNAETLRRHAAKRPVLAGVVGFNVVQDGDTFRRTTSGELVLERVDAARPLATALRDAKLPLALHDDLAPHQWTKLLINLNNAISALTDAPTREIVLSSQLRRIVAAVTVEALGVYRAAGIRAARLRGLPVGWMPLMMRLPTPIVRLLAPRVDPQARSSMWEDLRRGRPTEVDFLNGEIVRLAEAHGIAAPLNRAIVDAVHAAERERRGSPKHSAEQLESLLGL